MAVDEQVQRATPVQLLNNCAACMDARVLRRARFQVHAVQVDAARVRAVVATKHAVRIEHRDELEDEALAQRGRAWIIGTYEEGQESVEHMRCGRLAWVHARRNEHHRLVGECMRPRVTVAT